MICTYRGLGWGHGAERVPASAGKGFRAAARQMASVVTLAASLIGAGSAYAQTAEVMIPASPGGGWDRTARATMGAMQSEGLVSAVQYTNKGGSGGVIGLTDFVQSEKGNDDALMFMGVIMVGSAISSKSAITVDMTTPLARLTHEWLGLAVPADSPIKTVADFTDALKSDPKAVAVAVSGAGSIEHFALAQLAKEIGVGVDQINPVMFSGNEFVPALVGGKVNAAISGLGELVPLAEAGRIRVIAMTGPERAPNVDIPTLKEEGIDLVIGNWRGVVGAPEMSEDARKAWLERFDKLSKSQAFADALAKEGLENAYLAGDEFAEFLAAEQKAWEGTLTELGLVN